MTFVPWPVALTLGRTPGMRWNDPDRLCLRWFPCRVRRREVPVTLEPGLSGIGTV